MSPCFNMTTGQMNPITRQQEQTASTVHQPNNQRLLKLEDDENGPDQFTSSPMDHAITAINNMSHIFQRDATLFRMLYTQVPNCRGFKDKIHKFYIFYSITCDRTRIASLSSTNSIDSRVSGMTKWSILSKRCTSLQKQPWKMYWTSEAKRLPKTTLK